MRGHEQIISMRRRGLAPRTIFIDAFEDTAASWRMWPIVDASLPCVEVLPSDLLSGLELRFVVGLRVVISGHDTRRVAALQAMCVEAGAARVVATVIEADQITHQTDTAGYLSPSAPSKAGTPSLEFGPWVLDHTLAAPTPSPTESNRALEALL